MHGLAAIGGLPKRSRSLPSIINERIWRFMQLLFGLLNRCLAFETVKLFLNLMPVAPFSGILEENATFHLAASLDLCCESRFDFSTLALDYLPRFVVFRLVAIGGSLRLGDNFLRVWDEGGLRKPIFFMDLPDSFLFETLTV